MPHFMCIAVMLLLLHDSPVLRRKTHSPGQQQTYTLLIADQGAQPAACACAQVSQVQEASRQGSHGHCSDWQVVHTPAHKNLRHGSFADKFACRLGKLTTGFRAAEADSTCAGIYVEGAEDIVAQGCQP